MNEINNVSHNIKPDRLPPFRSAPERDATAESKPSLPEAREDRAEISELGRLLGLAGELSETRGEKVAEVKLALQQNEEQFIQQRLDRTVDRIAADLLGA